MACVNVTSQGAKQESYSHLQADVLQVFSLRVQGQRPAGGGGQAAALLCVYVGVDGRKEMEGWVYGAILAILRCLWRTGENVESGPGGLSLTLYI
jgi:hypothetical protein